MRVDFYSYDESLTYEFIGCIYEQDGKLVSKPDDNAVLRKIISEPLELPEETIPPSDTERFLDSLQKRYTSRDFAASHMFPIEVWTTDWNPGLADWEKPDWEKPVWKPWKLPEDYVEPDEDAEDNFVPLPPIPDWQRKPPRRRNREQPGLFDED